MFLLLKKGCSVLIINKFKFINILFAFLISTSGSTGRPKIVMQSHRNVLDNVRRYSNGLEIADGDRVALLASLSGGQGLATTWTTLLNGATLYPFPIAERGVTGLADWLEENGVTVFDTVPSVLRSFAHTLRDRRIPGVRLVRLASEGAWRSDFDAFTRHFTGECRLASVLGSSEAGVIAQGILRSDDSVADGALPVGRPAEGITIALLDEDGEPADGEGEIAVQGEHLSLGTGAIRTSPPRGSRPSPEHVGFAPGISPSGRPPAC